MEAPSSTVHDAGQSPRQHAGEASWPGRDVKVADYLPGSVYLWACGEPGEEGGPTPEVTDAVAAWIVLLTQAVLYSGLWYVGGNRYDPDDAGSSPEYSIFAVAGSMYLMLSIPAADLCGGCALVLEQKGWTWRRAFGVCLVGTFLLLVGASIRVLFYSSIENVELVLGSAAVLFIADVDEKVMVVLKNFSGQWRLFWVTEMVGLSFVLALFSVRVTGNDVSIGGGGQQLADGCGPLLIDVNCGVYTSQFIFTTMPIAVTLFALLLSKAVSNREAIVPVRILMRLSWGSRLAFLVLLVCWVWQESLWHATDTHQLARIIDSIQGGLVFLYLVLFCRGEIRQAFVDAKRIGETGRRRRWVLFGIMTGVIVSRVLLESVILCLSADATDEVYVDGGIYDYFFYFWGSLYDIVQLALYLWLIDGTWVSPSATPSPDITFADSARSMVLGWSLSNGVFQFVHYLLLPAWKAADYVEELWPVVYLLERMLRLVLVLAVGTWSRTAGGIGNIGFWYAASLLMWEVSYLLEPWSYSFESGILV